MKLWLNNNYNFEISSSFWILQIGMFISLIALPYFHVLNGLKKEYYYFFDALIQIILNSILFYLFSFILKINYSVYVSFSLSVFLSNLFIIYKCNQLIRLKNAK